MVITGGDITAWVGAYSWPFLRIGALFASAPVIGTRMVPLRIRLVLALAITALVVPIAPASPAIDPLSIEGVLVGVQQVLIGVSMGFALQLVFGAFMLGGQVMAMTMGLGFASLNDPVTGVVVPTVSQFYVVMVTLVFLALNGHLILIEVTVNSFDSLPISPDAFTVLRLWNLLEWAGFMFSGAVLIALPAIGAMLVVNLGFGIMTRAAPQLNIFAVGFPVIMTIGFVVILLSLPSVLPWFENAMDRGLQMTRQLVAN